jgi:hypothetical protein
VSRVLQRLTLAGALAVVACAHGWAAAQQSPAPASASSSSSASASSDTPRTPQEVIVTGHRASLPARVKKFVNQIAAVENGAGIPLWKNPVCPLVNGFRVQDAGVILRRLAEIARAANVPLGGDGCFPPNLFIVATDDPKGLLQQWNNESPTRMEVFGGAAQDLFAGAPQSAIDEFITTPRAVRVWYYTRGEDATGLTLSAQESPYTPPVIDHVEASHIVSNSITYDFFRVFVIADQRQLHGVTIAQLADYLSMVGLAKLKPGARLGDAPTILRLFGAAPRTAPAGLTDWDEAFLKSLYATEQRSTLQRRQIARDMVRQIGH